MFGAGSRAVLSKSPLPFELARRRADSLARDIAEASGAAGSRPATPQDQGRGQVVGVRAGQEAASFQVKSLIRQIEFAAGRSARRSRRGAGPARRGRAARAHDTRGVIRHGRGIVSEMGDVSRFETRPPGELRRAELVGEPVRAVRQRRRPHNQGGARPCLRPRFVAGGQPRQAVRPRAARLPTEARRQSPTAWPSRPWRGSCAIAFAVMRDQVPYDRGGIGRSCRILRRRPRRPLRHARKHSIFGSQDATFG